MATKKENIDLKVEIGTNDPKHWTKVEVNELQAQANYLATYRSDEKKIKNDLMAVYFKKSNFAKDKKD